MDDLDQALDRWRQGTDALVKGDPEPLKACWSHGDDVTVANPLGPPVQGWERVPRQSNMSHRTSAMVKPWILKSSRRHQTSDLAYVVQIEHMRARLGELEEVMPFSLRVTMVLRPEETGWKVVHRQADRSCRHSQSNR